MTTTPNPKFREPAIPCWKFLKCGRSAIKDRWYPEGAWKPVCHDHLGGALPMELRALQKTNPEAAGSTAATGQAASPEVPQPGTRDVIPHRAPAARGSGGFLNAPPVEAEAGAPGRGES